MFDGRDSISLVTGQAGDYVVEEGTTHLVWVLGRGPLAAIAGVNISDAASAVSGTARTRLLGAAAVPRLGPGVRQWVVAGRNTSLPATPTHYACSVHQLPAALRRRRHHVLRYEADIGEWGHVVRDT